MTEQSRPAACSAGAALAARVLAATDGAPGCGYQGRMTAAVGAVGTDLDVCAGSCSRALARARQL